MVLCDIGKQNKRQKVQKLRPSEPFLHSPEMRVESEEKKREYQINIQRERERINRKKRSKRLERRK